MADDSAQTGDAGDTERRQLNFFYRDGTPATAGALLDAFARTGLPALVAAAGDPARRAEAGERVNQQFLFFARAAEGRPEVVRAYEAVARALPVEQVAAVLKLLAHAGDAATLFFLHEFAAQPGNHPVAAFIADLLRKGLGRDADIEAAASAEITAPEHLDRRWTEFMAAGDPAKVAEIVAVLGWPDRLRAHLERLLAPRRGLGALFGGNGKAAAIMRGLTPLGFRFDPKTHAIVNAEDVDLLAILREGRPDGGRFKAFVEALPSRPEPALAIAAATKASALWSLASNAGEHPRVLAVCEAAAAKASGATRLALLEIVALAQARRGEFAAALKAWTAYREQAPGREGLDERIEALALEQRFAALAVPATEGARVLTAEASTAAARACAELLARTPAYHVRAQHRRIGEADSDEVMLRSEWRGQHVGGDRTRMSRAFWTRQSAEGLADEWIDIGADNYMCGPGMWLKTPPGFVDRAVDNAVTRKDRFVALLLGQRVSAGRSDEAAIELVYEAAQVGDLGRLGVSPGPVRVSLTIERATHWLARAQVASLPGVSPGFELTLRFVAPARPLTLEAPPGALDMSKATPGRPLH